MTKRQSVLLRMSPLQSHATYCLELEKARQTGKGRQFRGIAFDGDTDLQARFGWIANRSSYERRRGRC